MSVNEWSWMNNKIIDLHGVRHHNVVEVLEKSLLGYHHTQGWEIITGNSPYMIEIVEEFLRTNLFKFYRTPDNYGRIILAH
mgnify:FL=1|jgi:hypothetical protein